MTSNAIAVCCAFAFLCILFIQKYFEPSIVVTKPDDRMYVHLFYNKRHKNRITRERKLLW